MINALAVLLGCQLLGEIAVRVLGAPVPGPVVGAALLAGVLAVRGIPSFLPPVAHGILRNLSLLFVPAAVGVVQYGPLLAEHGLALAVILVVSTALAMAVTALVFRLVGGRVGGGER
jgi:holin-like protein